MERRDPSAIALVILIAGSALVFDPGGWQTFGPTKWLVITVAAWAALTGSVRRGLVVHRGSAIAWGVFVGWAILTSITALEPVSAFLGTPERRLGLVGVATMAAAYLAGQQIDRADGRRRIARTMAVTLVAMGGYGLAELAGLDVKLTTTTDRLGATFGSPAYLGAALALLIPASLGLLTQGGERPAWRVTGAIGVVAGLGLLVGSGTRAAAVGLVVAAVATGLAWWPWARRRLRATAAIAVGVTLVVMISPLGGRLADLESNPLAASRLDEWSVAASAVARRPLLGAGLEGYRVVFPGVVSADYVRAYGRATVTDRAHSGPLDLGVAMGIAGVAAWLLAAAWLTFRAVKAAGGTEPALIGVAAGTVALLAQEVFLFPTLEVGVAGWAVAGIVVTATRTTEPFWGSLSTHRMVVGALAGVTGVLLVAGALDVAADHRAAAARASEDLAVADAAVALRPDSFRYRLLAADIAARAGNLPEAGVRLQAARRIAPLDPGLRLAELRVQAGGPPSPETLAAAEAAARADPNHPQVRIIQGDQLAQAGRGAEAERAWLAAEYLSPADPAIPLRLAYLYLETGAVDAAGDAIERLRRLEPDNPQLADLEERLAET